MPGHVTTNPAPHKAPLLKNRRSPEGKRDAIAEGGRPTGNGVQNRVVGRSRANAAFGRQPRSCTSTDEYEMGLSLGCNPARKGGCVGSPPQRRNCQGC